MRSLLLYCIAPAQRIRKTEVYRSSNGTRQRRIHSVSLSNPAFIRLLLSCGRAVFLGGKSHFRAEDV